jgi:phage FluMu protein Com
MRLLPPRQTSSCSGCGLVITERRRKPCPRCQGINRTISVAAEDRFAVTDRAS